MKTRRQPINTITAAVAVMTGAGRVIDPPGHCELPECALPFWDAVTRGRAREEWEATPSLLVTASNLAWTQWQIVELRKMIQADDLPDAKVVSRMTEMQRLEMAYLRTLQQHGRGAEGEARDVNKRRGIVNEIKANNPLDDDLLARPSIQ